MKFRNKLKLYIILAIITVVFGGGIFYYWIVNPSKMVIRAGEQIAQGMAAALDFAPHITVDNTVIFEEPASIIEVAFFSRRLVHDFRYRNTWLGSTKELNFRGVYLAKYGFNIREQNFMLNISEANSADSEIYRLTFVLPEPVLLSFETEDFKILRDEDGWWNSVTASEREKAVNDMRNSARSKALSAENTEQAKTAIQAELIKLIRNLPLEIRIGQIEFQWREMPAADQLTPDSLSGGNFETHF